MTKNYFLVLFFLFSGMLFGLHAQEPRIFKVVDFDLKGKVKSCLVVTKYGKEEYDFDEEGRLTKSVTRFSETDYDVTHYKFEDGELTEKRMENYRDGEFEASTSIGNFYSLDQVEPRVLTEKIFSYDKEFLDSYQYHYDLEGNLIKIARSNNEGEDETEIKYKENGKHIEQIFSLNGVIQKTVKVTHGTEKGTSSEYTEQYVQGIRSSAVNKTYNKDAKLIAEAKFIFDEQTNKFRPQGSKTYSYDEKGMLKELITNEGEVESAQEYIYQYDNEETGNWVKEIITPDNLYTTRRIKYYPSEKVVEKEE